MLWKTYFNKFITIKSKNKRSYEGFLSESLAEYNRSFLKFKVAEQAIDITFRNKANITTIEDNKLNPKENRAIFVSLDKTMH